MASTNNNPYSTDPRDYIYDYGGQIITGISLDGPDAVGSSPIFAGTDDVEGTGGELCYGSPSGNSEQLVIRVLPGSGGDRILRRALNNRTCTYFAIRRRGHALTESTYFSDEAIVKSSPVGRIRHGTAKDPIEYTLTVKDPIDNDLRTVLGI